MFSGVKKKINEMKWVKSIVAIVADRCFTQSLARINKITIARPLLIPDNENKPAY